MHPVSKFRGTSGEVVTQFISPMTYVSALPIVAGMLILSWVCGYFGTYRTYISTFFMSVFLIMATMRHAIPASRGDMEPTNDLGEIVTYTGRNLLLNAAWFIPWILLWNVQGKSATVAAPAFMMNPLSLLQSPLILLLRALLVLCVFLLPSLCLLVSLYSSTIKGLFTRHSWSWLLNQRRQDLAPYWSGLLGGSLVMMLCALLPSLVLIYIGFKDTPKTGMYIAGFLYFWVSSTIPELNGKLAGVFVADDFVQLEFIEDEPLTIVAEQVSPVPVIRAQPVEAKPDMANIESRMAAIEPDRLTEAVEAAVELETSMSAPIRGQIEQMLLAIRQGDKKNALSSAAKAIDGATQRGFTDIGMKLFERLGGDRRSLKLAAYSLEILGNMYQQKKLLLDAAWCFHAAANTAGDSIKAQKRLFQIAEIAEKSGNNKDAHTLYGILLKQYPDSTLSEFAQQGAARTKSQND